MKIAILTSGILPVPAVQGGAVENLVDFYLEYNDEHQLHDITVYSIADEKTKGHPALQSSVNHYHYIETKSLFARIKKWFFRRQRNEEGYYHYTIEYFLEQALRHLSRQHYDMIIIENRPGYAISVKRVTSARLIYHFHNDFLSVETSHYQELYDSAFRIITVSDYIRSRVKTINPTDTKSITVHNGIDISAFSQEPTISRKDLGLSNDDFVIVFSGRINPEKGISELIEAITELHGIPSIKLLIIGSNFYDLDNNKNAFQSELEAKATPIQDKIKFTGFIPYHNIPSYLRIADIAVLPSIWEEPFGLTMLEAMASGLPLITTRSGGIPEVCEGVATLVERENLINNLVDAILDLYQHPEKRKAMSLAGKQRSKAFDKKRYAKEFFQAIE